MKFLDGPGLKILKTWIKSKISSAQTAAENAAAQNALENYLPKTARGAANGVASLDGSGLVPANQLPSFVDDVLEFADRTAFPSPGERGKIYLALDTNRSYRWSGTTYVEIKASPGTTDDVAEGSTNKYYHSATAIADAKTAIGNIPAVTKKDHSNGINITVTTEGGSVTNVDVDAPDFQSTYVPLVRTIAGVDLQDNVTKTELLAALNVADGATADTALTAEEINDILNSAE